MTKCKNIPKAKRTINCFFSAVQHERGPRNSTIRRQMALLLKESSDLISAYHHHQHQFRPHPVPPSFHHPLSSNNSVVHPTPKYPLDLRTSIIESSYDAQESAARILFNAINWAKTVPAFISLSTRDQVKENFLFKSMFD